MSHRFQGMVQYESNFRFRVGYLFLTHYFSVISNNIAMSHILPKTRFFGLHLRCRKCGSNFNHCDVVGPKSTKVGEIKQNKGYTSFKVIQDH